MKVFVSYLTPQVQEFEIPDKFYALTRAHMSQNDYHKLEEQFDRYVERKIRPVLEAKTPYDIDLCRIVDEDGDALTEY